MSFLEIVEFLMSEGWDEDSACREAYAQTCPESYESNDYE